MVYRAPVHDIVFTMRHAAGFDRAVSDGLYEDLSADLATTVLEEAGRFANDVIAPLNRAGDRSARRSRTAPSRPRRAGTSLSRLDRGRLERACRARSISAARGCRILLNSACVEMWNSACMAFGICPLLTHGRDRGADRATARTSCKARYLGSWSPANGPGP